MAWPARLMPTFALITALAGGCQVAVPDSTPRAPAVAPLLNVLDAEPASETAGGAADPIAVTTVLTPEAKHRDISLAECIALALENGRTGEFFDAAGGLRRTSVTGLVRGIPPQAQSDSIRVFAFDPAVAGTDIDQALARFDVLWQTRAVFDRVDEPAGIDNASAFFPSVSGLNKPTVSSIASSSSFISGFNRLDTGEFSTGLIKPLATGGVAGITFRTDYFQIPSQTASALRFPDTNDQVVLNNPLANPAIRPAVDFTFEQPLLRGNGVLINQIRDSLPGSVRNLLPPGGRAPGILVARITMEQSRLEFERRVQELVFTVEEAYWDLYASYWDLYSREAGLRQALSAWQVAKQRFALGGVGAEEVAQIEAQYQGFRRQRLEALGNGGNGRLGVLEAERRLRYVVGLPAEDGSRLIPSDHPTDTPYLPDWTAAVADARSRRPELLTDPTGDQGRRVGGTQGEGPSAAGPALHCQVQCQRPGADVRQRAG